MFLTMWIIAHTFQCSTALWKECTATSTNVYAQTSSSCVRSNHVFWAEISCVGELETLCFQFFLMLRIVALEYCQFISLFHPSLTHIRRTFFQDSEHLKLKPHCLHMVLYTVGCHTIVSTGKSKM